MNRIIRHVKTLVFYDGPQLFLSADQFKTQYLCLLVECKSDLERYLCVPISPRRLSEFYSGGIDLRKIYEKPEIEELFYSDIRDEPEQQIILTSIAKEKIPESWLPDEGYIFEREPGADELIEKEAEERQRAIIHLSLNPPEARDETKINALTLSDAVKTFQNLMKYAFKKAIADLNQGTKKSFESPDNYGVEIFEFSPGSFTIHMQSVLPADILGYAQISKALEKIDELIEPIGDPEKTLEVIKQNRGHLASMYRHLLRLVITHDAPISYEWTMPKIHKVMYQRITIEDASSIYKLLMEKQELGIEHIILMGRVLKVDVGNGTWRLLNDEDNKEYRGLSDPSGPAHLGGIIIETERYKFVCEEHLEEEIVTGKEKTILFLKSYEKL